MMVEQIKRLFGLDEAAIRDERRHEPRRRTYLTVEIHPVMNHAGLFVETVSRTGFIGKTEARLRPGQQILFSTGTPVYHAGTVRWVKGSRLGVQLADALAAFGYEPGRTRTQRYRARVEGKIAVAPASFRATLRDVSQCGLRLDSDVSLDLGQQVLVRMPDARLVPASVEWTADKKIGLRTADRIAILRLVYTYE